MDLSGKVIKNRYKIDRPIATDIFGDLYLAYDLVDNTNPLLIKFLNTTFTSKKIEDFIRFKTEIDLIAACPHEHIVKVRNIGEVIELNYVVMEYVDGISLLNLIANNLMPTDQCVEYIIQICRTLEFLHAQKILHRDLNPGNIFIADNKVKLFDIGLSHLKEFSDFDKSAELSKVFGYLSPEHSGLVKRPLDERSDLYAVGVIFYELLTGKLPFEAQDLCSIVHQQIAKVPDAPQALNPKIPSILNRMILKLLKKAPEDRYQSAKGIIADLEKYKNGQRGFILGLNDHTFKLTYRSRLIGRESELNKLQKLFHRAKRGRGAICFVSGDAGTGKTRLIEELKDYVYTNGSVLIDGKCSTQSNKTPFEPFRDVLRAYLENFNNYPKSRKQHILQTLQEEFKTLGKIILKLNPMMKEILGKCPPLVALESDRESDRFHMVTRQFFQRLSQIENGMVLVIDDLQWTDSSSIEVLEEMLNKVSDYPLVIICVFRDAEISETHAINQLKSKIKADKIYFRSIHLDVFDTSTMNVFIARLLMTSEEKTGDIAQFILNKSKGNPFFAIEILKQLIEEKALLYEKQTWRFDKPILDQMEISPSIVGIILKRIQLLDDKEKSLLSYAAVIGKIFDINLLFGLKIMDTTEIVSIIDRAIDLHLLEAMKEKGKISFVHCRVKEAFYDILTDEDKMRRHLIIAQVIEKENENGNSYSIFDLAHHYIEGGDKEKSLAYAYPAGNKATSEYANEEAIRYYKIALALLEESGQKESEQWIELHFKIGQIYLTAGKYDRAIYSLLEMLPYTKTLDEKVSVYASVCSAYFRTGDWEKCDEYGRVCAKLLNEKIYDSPMDLYLAIFKECFIHLLHSLFPFIFIKKYSSNSRYKARLKVRFAAPLIWMYLFTDTLKFVQADLRVFNIARTKLIKSANLGLVMMGYAALFKILPMFERSLKLHKKALEISKEANDESVISQVLQSIGYCYQWKGDYKESLNYFKKSVERCNVIGDIRGYSLSLLGILHSYYYMGDYEQSEKLNQEYAELSIAGKDGYGIGLSKVISAQNYLEQGQLERAEKYAIDADTSSFEKKIWFNVCRSKSVLGRIYLAKGNVDTAIEHFKNALSVYERNNFIKEYTIGIYGCLAEAYLHKFIRDAIINKDRRTSKKNIRQIKNACKKALRKTRRWPSQYGTALRISAQYYQLAGNPHKAEELFLKSAGYLKNVGRRYELAKTYYEYSLFLTQMNDTKKSMDQLVNAYQLFCEIGSQGYILTIQKLLGIREESDQITSITKLIDKERLLSIQQLTYEIHTISNIHDLLDKILSKAIEISGAQQGCIYLLNESNELEERVSRSFQEKKLWDLGFPLAIARTVVDSKSYVIMQDAAKETPSLGNLPNNAITTKSVICVPIEGRENVIGVCYLENTLSGGVFTEKEADVLSNFLFQSSFAIENLFLRTMLNESKSPSKKGELNDVAEEKVQIALDYINQNYLNDISRKKLARIIGIHPDSLGKYFKSSQGKKMNEYVNELRIKDAAQKLVDQPDDTIIDVAFSVGFESLSTFNRAFSKVMKISPSEYRKRAVH